MRHRPTRSANASEAGSEGGSEADDGEYLGVARVPGALPPKTPPPAAAPAKSRWGDLVVRVTMSWVMVLSFAAIIWAGHLAVLTLVLVLQAFMFTELTGLRVDHDKERRLKLFKFMRWYFFLVCIMFAHGKSLRRPVKQCLRTMGFSSQLLTLLDTHEFLCFMLYCVGLVLFVLSLRKWAMKYQFGSFVWTHLTLVLAILQTSWMGANIFRGLIWFVMPTFLIICNDCSAYVFGRAFGKTPLIALSPKKTVEGFAGALLFTVAFGFYLTKLLAAYEVMVCPKLSFDLRGISCRPDPVFAPTTFTMAGVEMRVRPVELHSIAFSIFASLIGPFGGFFASALKRVLKKKDFGDMFPGHGGFVDRFDCQVLMSAFVYFYCLAFVRGTRKVGDAMEMLMDLSDADQRTAFDILSQTLHVTPA